MSKLLFLFHFLIFSSFSSFGYEVSFVSYNVENLFDANHDVSHEDFTYLPLKHDLKKKCNENKNDYYRRYCQTLDWTKEKVELKISQHIKVLNELTFKPDFLGLVEIENLKLAEKFSKIVKGKPQTLITTGDDERGIHIALLFDSSRFKLIKKKEVKTLKGSRNLLICTFKEKKSGHIFGIIGNHWPSQRSPTSSRVEVARLVQSEVKILKEKNPKIKILAYGDFNTLEKEHPHPFHNILLEGTGLTDSADKNTFGSYFYMPSMSWNLLDRIFYSTDGVKRKSFEVLKPEFATTVLEYKKKNSPFYGSRIVGAPKKSKHKAKKKLGYSDHFPVYGIYEIKN